VADEIIEFRRRFAFVSAHITLDHNILRGNITATMDVMALTELRIF